ncbi:guanine nucleotide-binding alpha-3 subunit [Fusarium beomiforme]|uniref:Guanine nucleotide-binding alpha-3 subunit n=1 Tax=Fusarium beomiforme TaxID=44412 RepID=A0A9P5A5G6_9HYPO|nr:guanine nucleotide-binding alpha-3 subunit [Fusarium beomiforme]
MSREKGDCYTNTSGTDGNSLNPPKPIIGQGAGSRLIRAESSRARWWEGLRLRSRFSISITPPEPPKSEEVSFPPLPSYPAEAEARTRVIDEYLTAESQRRKRQLKVILFGDEHDKSLFLKQTRLLELPLSEDELADVRVEARRFVASICRECLLIVAACAGHPEWIYVHPVLGRVKEFVSRQDTEGEETVESMVDLYCDSALRLALKQFGLSLENIERRFLNSRFPHILTCSCTANVNLSKLLKRIFAPEYVPTDHDWFHFDHRRLEPMAQEALIRRSSHTVRFLQPRNTSTERRKWIHILVNDAACVLFISDLAIYDQNLLEDETMNSLHENFMLFSSLVNSKWFTQTPFFVILSNISAFRNKLPQSPLSKWFPEFEGGSDGDEAVEFIKDRFRKLAKADQNVYIHVADIYSAPGVTAAIEAMENTSLSKVLKELGTTSVEGEY